MKHSRSAAALAVAFPLCFPAASQTANPVAEAPTKNLGVVTVTGGQPTSLPTQIPTTMEGITREQIEQTVNATDSEDALKYFPSLLVRKRYIGDYNHAVLSSRASGTGNSARSAVYADGILLSNYLGNGAAYTPRWGLVTPEEIERVDVMYGPFSAAYPGNSVGAVVDYVTRMPTRFEVHAKAGYFVQPFDLYNTHETYKGWQTSASVGNKNGDWSWWLNFNHTDSHGQPLTFATRLLSAGGAPTGPVVNGAVLDANNQGKPWYVLGTATEYRTRQDHAKVKLAYDFSPTVRASYTLGVWQNDATARSVSYLRDAAGNPVYSGPVTINGVGFSGANALNGNDFPQTNERITHLMHGLSVKTHTQGVWDWEVAASLYDFGTDRLRRNSRSNPSPAADVGGPGQIVNQNGTGWNALAFKGTWRPQGTQGAHLVDFGLQQDSYQLHILSSDVPGNWQTDPAGPTLTDVRGKTQLQSLWAQDVWAFAPDWKTVLGLRGEHWTASDGVTRFSASNALSYPGRSENHLSPKGALAYQWASDLVLKASVGRAVRMPTVNELYGSTSIPGSLNAVFVNDPDLRPEKSWTTELSAEKDLGNSLLRLTFFTENVRDSLYSQTTFDPAANLNVTRVQNVDRIFTQGMELAFNGNDVLHKGLDLQGSVTYADSIIKANTGFVSVPGDTVGKRQPNVPRWRASALASYRWDSQLTTSLGVRYSGTQFRTLNNSDVNGFTYQGVSRFLTADLRVRYQIDRQWSAAFGIDNLNNDKYWNFHPYPQRSYSAELKVDI
ncbi:MAG: TonB-dependent receptor [Burkholderiales bacterium]|nr:TonB-dependent receptor [Burkholderiales bacterium]